MYLILCKFHRDATAFHKYIDHRGVEFSTHFSQFAKQFGTREEAEEYRAKLKYCKQSTIIEEK